MDNELINQILVSYFAWCSGLSQRFGWSLDSIKLVAAILIAMLVFLLWLLANPSNKVGTNCKHTTPVDSDCEVKASVKEDGLCEQNLALAEAYLEMHELDKVRQCLSKITFSSLTNDESIRRINSLQQRLDQMALGEHTDD